MSYWDNFAVSVGNYCNGFRGRWWGCWSLLPPSHKEYYEENADDDDNDERDDDWNKRNFCLCRDVGTNADVTFPDCEVKLHARNVGPLAAHAHALQISPWALRTSVTDKPGSGFQEGVEFLRVALPDASSGIGTRSHCVDDMQEPLSPGVHLQVRNK